MQGRQNSKGIVVFFCLLAFSLLLLLLSVCDDIADVLVVYIAGNIWGEGGPHVLNLLRGKPVALSGQELLKEFLLDGSSTLGVQDGGERAQRALSPRPREAARSGRGAL